MHTEKTIYKETFTEDCFRLIFHSIFGGDFMWEWKPYKSSTCLQEPNVGPEMLELQDPAV
jgi:hypothetical protein